MWKKWRIWGLGTALAVLMLTACEEKKVDYGIGETEAGGGSTQQANALQSMKTAGTEQFAGEERWEEQWSVTGANGKEQEITVKTNISVPEEGEMYVISASEWELSETEKEKIAKGWFDGEIYTLDEKSIPKEEYEDIIAELTERMETAKENGDEEEYQRLSEQLAEYQGKQKNAPDNYVLAENFSADRYLGEHGGTAYELEMTKEENACWGIEAHIRLAVHNSTDLCPDALAGTASIGCMGHTDAGLFTQENHCGFSLEQARQKAQAALEELGFSYTVYAYSLPLVWEDYTKSSDTDEPYINGYEIYYDAGYQDVSFRAGGDELAWMNFHIVNNNEHTEEVYSLDSYAVVKVTEKGIYSVDVYNPVEMENITGPVRLLKLDAVCDSIRTQLCDKPGLFLTVPEDIYLYNRMELLYFRMADKEKKGHYSYIPVWRLSHASDTVTYGIDGAYSEVDNVYNEVMVNAVDGSVVRFADDLFFGQDGR